jgi:hypothetical protein
MPDKTEYENFEKLASTVLKVPHTEVKAKLDEEKQAKKRKKSRKSSASGRVKDGRA